MKNTSYKANYANLDLCVQNYFEVGNFNNDELYSLCQDYLFAKNFFKFNRLIYLLNKK
jgi:hypothetical protein